MKHNENITPQNEIGYKKAAFASAGLTAASYFAGSIALTGGCCEPFQAFMCFSAMLTGSGVLATPCIEPYLNLINDSTTTCSPGFVAKLGCYTACAVASISASTIPAVVAKELVIGNCASAALMQEVAGTVAVGSSIFAGGMSTFYGAATGASHFFNRSKKQEAPTPQPAMGGVPATESTTLLKP